MATSADYRLGEFAFARGWFAVANASDVGRKPLSIWYFGQDLVIYRGESGRVVLLDAYCPHMGTHMGRAESSATWCSETHMEGDNIRCPYHAWRFGPDGVCNDIPYHDGPIPPQARVKSWHVEERYGIVFAWHDPEEQEPDFGLPEFSEWDDPEWVRWDGLGHVADLGHPVEIFDNMSDVAHLTHLHGTPVKRYENEYEGHVMHQREAAGVTGQLAETFGQTMSTLAGYIGPGIAFGEHIELQGQQIMCVTPIEDGTCRFWQATMVKPPEGVTGEDALRYRDQVNRAMEGGFLQDAEIWRTKRPALHIMQLPGDGPFRQSRVWYSQFFNPRAKTPEIVARIAGMHTARGMPAYTQAEAAE